LLGLGRRHFGSYSTLPTFSISIYYTHSPRADTHAEGWVVRCNKSMKMVYLYTVTYPGRRTFLARRELSAIAIL